MVKSIQEIDKNRLTYFLLSRSIFDSPIWSDDPHVLKIFLYIIGTARYSKKPKRFPGFSIKRGEMVTSLTAIAENNCYMQNKVLKTMSKQKIMRILDLLQEQGYIKRLSDTYGTHLTVCNYDTYQTSKNYKSDDCGTELEQSSNEVGTGLETYNKGKKEKKEKNKIANSLENISKEYKELFFSWLGVYFEIHGKMTEAAQEAQYRRLKDIPKDKRIKCLNDAIAGQWKNIQDIKVEDKEQSKMTEF